MIGLITSRGDLDRIFDINVKGLFFTVQKAVPLLTKGSAPSVVLTGSAGALKGMAGLAAYVASKATVRSLVRSLSAELIPLGIRVNNLSPGPIETPIYERMGLPEEQGA